MLRLARAIVFAVACVAVSATGHALAGGAAVAPGTLTAGALFALALAWALNGRERGPEVVLPATVGAQVVLHLLFATPAPAHSHFGLGMPLAHLVVAALTGWWLHRGENAFWLMVRLWISGLPRLLLPVTPLPEVRQAAAHSVHIPLVARWVATTIHRRGPPRGSRPPNSLR